MIECLLELKKRNSGKKYVFFSTIDWSTSKGQSNNLSNNIVAKDIKINNKFKKI